MLRQHAVHAPALSLNEAAMLPAIWPEAPRNLLLSHAGLDFRTGAVDAGGRPVDNPIRRGSMAGRAILHHVRSASARRQRR